MDTSLIIVLIAIALFGIGSLLILAHFLKINKWDPKGKGAQKQIERILERYSVLRRFRVLSNVTLTFKGKNIPVQTILVGFFGILIVHTEGARGEYYGKVEDKSWVFVPDTPKKDLREEVPNPLFVQQQAMQSLRTLFGKEKIYNITVEQAVVVSNKSKKTAVFVTQENLVFKTKGFKSYLQRTKFDKDNGVDIEKVCSVIEKNSKENTPATL